MTYYSVFVISEYADIIIYSISFIRLLKYINIVVVFKFLRIEMVRGRVIEEHTAAARDHQWQTKISTGVCACDLLIRFIARLAFTV